MAKSTKSEQRRQAKRAARARRSKSTQTGTKIVEQGGKEVVKRVTADSEKIEREAKKKFVKLNSGFRY